MVAGDAALAVGPALMVVYVILGAVGPAGVGKVRLSILASPYLIPQLGPYLNPYLNWIGEVRLVPQCAMYNSPYLRRAVPASGVLPSTPLGSTPQHHQQTDSCLPRHAPCAL